MKKYSYLHSLVLAFFAKSLYQDVAKNWRGTGFLYIFMLLALTWVPIMFLTHHNIMHWLSTQESQMIQQIPTINVNKGELSVDTTVPHFIHEPQTGKIMAIIDTSGQFNNLSNTNANILITKKTIYIRKNGEEVREFEVSKFNNTTITKEKIQSWLDITKTWFALLAYPFAVLGSFLYRVFQVVIYTATAGMIFNTIFRANLDFQTILRLTAIAITPAIIINTIVSFFGLNISHNLLMYLLLSLSYLAYAINANKN